ncbi:hypothetical protein R1flu_003165 [Riccia fluitans]|uniref:Transmembrane protein n=1 Tax=Riccia fluitans TaxID=41844 RepID=A0ABD1Y8D6_9MARC
MASTWIPRDRSSQNFHKIMVGISLMALSACFMIVYGWTSDGVPSLFLGCWTEYDAHRFVLYSYEKAGLQERHVSAEKANGKIQTNG